MCVCTYYQLQCRHQWLLMGLCQHAGTGKNKKVTENFPPASVLVCGLKNEISLTNYYSSLKLVRFKKNLFWVAIIVQNCLKIV
jgi:hypothetical protein